MRMFMPLTALVCSMHLAFGADQNTEFAAPNIWDPVPMLTFSFNVLGAYEDRMEAAIEKGDGACIELQNDEEKAELFLAAAYMLLAHIRLAQETACLQDQEQSSAMLRALSEHVALVFSIMPEEVQKQALGFVRQILTLSEKFEGDWQPAQDVELYKPADTWKELRINVGRECFQAELAE